MCIRDSLRCCDSEHGKQDKFPVYARIRLSIADVWAVFKRGRGLRVQTPRYNKTNFWHRKTEAFFVTNLDVIKVYFYANDAKLYNTVTYTEDQLCLQRVINRLKDWCDKWLPKLNVSKSKFVSYSVKNRIDTEYYLNDGNTNIYQKVEKPNNIKKTSALLLKLILKTDLQFNTSV